MKTIAGVTTTVETTITDWRAFGRHVAGAESTQQADFLAGLAEAMVDAQVPYIADDVAAGNAADAVHSVLWHLTDAIGSRA